MKYFHSRPCCDFMDFPSEYTTNVYTIPIENIGMICQGGNISIEFFDFFR
jgi:hypothetical protein